MAQLLAGDIGGTKTSLALIDTDRGPREPVAEATYASADYPGLEAIALEFLGGRDHRVEAACFGVAGPVVSARATITNLPWVLAEAALARRLELGRVRLINDLVAVAEAISILEPRDLQSLSEGAAVEHGPIAVIAPGTGLGEAYRVHDGRRYRSFPSEGGHADFGPNDAVQFELLGFLRRRFGHASWERACSGRGIANLYDFLKESGRYEEPDWLADELSKVIDRTPLISGVALEADCRAEICLETMRLFVSILGAEAGNTALQVLATGGVYLAGGIPPRILPLLTDGRFEEAFCDKGRFTGLMRSIPVQTILTPKAALYGAAVAGIRDLERA